jgi:hypothetical protein
MGMASDPVTGLILPTQFIDEKQSLKKSIDRVVEDAVNELSYIKDNYYLCIHAKFDRFDPTKFNVSTPRATFKLPPFMSNQLVYWISPKRGICELLWMVAPKRGNEKLKVEFNKTGVAYLQAKGAMPSQ